MKVSRTLPQNGLEKGKNEHDKVYIYIYLEETQNHLRPDINIIVQGLKAFASCEVTVNDEHTKPRFKRKLGD